MKAAIFHEVSKPLTIEDIDDPVPAPGEAVIKVGRCGICGTDLHMTSSHQYAPAPGSTLGHEFSGEVVALGKGVDRLKIGDMISAMPFAGCGACIACLGGRPFACEQMRTMYGGFGEYALVRADLATLLPKALSVADGALVEPLAAALRGVAKIGPSAGAKILILGAGSMGVGTIFWARRLGAGKIVAADIMPWREPLALEMGASRFILSDDNLASHVVEAMGGAPDIVFECAGVPGLIAQAMDIVRPGGTVVVLGGCMQADHFVPVIGVGKEISILFSAAYTLNDFHIVIDTLDDGWLEPRGMITDTLPLSATPAIFETLRGPNRQCKVMIDPWMD